MASPNGSITSYKMDNLVGASGDGEEPPEDRNNKKWIPGHVS